MKKLTIIKSIHSLIWIFFNGMLLYLYYAVLQNHITKWVWICIGLFALEGIVLSAFKNVCPLTILARKYSDSPKSNFDIFLPEWLARNNKLIYTLLLLIAIAILIYRLIS